MNARMLGKAVSFGFAAICLSGCATTLKLPEVSGSLVEYRRTDPCGGTHVVARDVQVTDDAVKAASVTWSTTYPQFSITLNVENYERKR